MFDTVRANYQVIIPLETFEQLEEKDLYKVEINERLKRETGELTFKAQIKKHKIPYIIYYSETSTLIFEFSIPKFLYGSNHKLINERELINEHGINLFYVELSNVFKNLLKININVNEIKVTQLHVCYNLDICDTGYTVQEWLSFISKQRVPWKPKKFDWYDGDELTGVTFKTRKGNHSLTFYDKEAEMINNKNPYSDEAKNILRVEVKTSKKDITSYGSSKLTDLLTAQFFHYIIDRYSVNKLLKAKCEEQEQSEIPYLYLLEQQIFSISQLETIVGFLKIKDELQELAPPLYERATYNNRQSLLEKFYKKVNKSINRKLLLVEL